jgi:hypothetical protein
LKKLPLEPDKIILTRLLSGVNASFNWDLQLGASLTLTSDVYSLCVKTLSGNGGGIGLLTFYDLTQ